jgi:hypothetical protein
MTVAPELWSRVIVIQWQQLLPLVPTAERGLANQDPETCGRALEHLMIGERQPVINCYVRTRDGHFRARSLERSRSAGARAAPNFPGLFNGVLTSWMDLESATSGCYTTSGRVIFPTGLPSTIELRSDMIRLALKAGRPVLPTPKRP